MLRIINNMSDSDKCSDDDDSDIDNDAILSAFEHCQVSESVNDSDEDQPTQSGCELVVTCYLPGCDLVTTVSQQE